MPSPKMTRADAAALWDLLCHVDGPRDNPFAVELGVDDARWQHGAIDGWLELTRSSGWDRAEVMDAVAVLARWAREDDWRRLNNGERMPILPAHINELIELRRSMRTQARPADLTQADRHA